MGEQFAGSRGAAWFKKTLSPQLLDKFEPISIPLRHIDGTQLIDFSRFAVGCLPGQGVAVPPGGESLGYRDALVCAQAAQTVLDLEPEMILYGHHEPVVGADLIQREVTAYRDAIHHVHDAVVEGMNHGTDLATLQQEITLPPECEVGEGYGMVAWSVRAIWEHYAGWFKHESTTELYAVPQKAIHGDLVELAGADALIERARKKATAGQREQALHLLDIVMSAEPGNEAATALCIEVHESLLEDARSFRTTGNFWLEGWLEQQIKRLRGGKDVSLREVLR